MNYIKQAVLVLFMAMLAISCSDDKAVDTGDGDGDGNGDAIPNTKVVVTTEVDGNVENTKTIEIIDDSFIPSTAAATGSYNELTKLFSIQIMDTENSLPKFQISFTGRLNGFVTGSNSFTKGGDNFIGASYMNKEIDETVYSASSVEFNITGTKYIGLADRTLGTYYTSGDITMVVDNGEKTMTIRISLDNAPIAYTNMSIGG